MSRGTRGSGGSSQTPKGVTHPQDSKRPHPHPQTGGKGSTQTRGA